VVAGPKLATEDQQLPGESTGALHAEARQRLLELTQTWDTGRLASDLDWPLMPSARRLVDPRSRICLPRPATNSARRERFAERDSGLVRYKVKGVRSNWL